MSSLMVSGMSVVESQVGNYVVDVCSFGHDQPGIEQ